RAHLAHRNGGQPDESPESCGWRRDNTGQFRAQGECIGWTDGDDVYLEAPAAFRAAQIAARDGCEQITVSEQILKKRLSEKKLLASTDERRGTLTIRRTLCGSGRDVLHFHRKSIVPGTAEDPTEDRA